MNAPLPDQLHVYIGCSHLNPGRGLHRNNTEPGNGWGAVIVEQNGNGLVNARTIFGITPLSINDDEHSAEFALLKALEDVADRYPANIPIHVHTNHQMIPRIFDRMVREKSQYTESSKQYSTVLKLRHPSLVPIVDTIELLTMDIGLIHVNRPPVGMHEEHMEKAHRVAHAAALEDRLARQGYIHTEGRFFRGQDAKYHIEHERGRTR